MYVIRTGNQLNDIIYMLTCRNLKIIDYFVHTYFSNNLSTKSGLALAASIFPINTVKLQGK